MNKKIKNLFNQKFGKLTVISFYGKHGSRVAWNCKCECGNVVLVQANNIGKTTFSCGCEKIKRAKNSPSFDRTTHGMYRNRTYISWRCMLDRCKYKYINGYKDYGGRGIKVCDRWLKFENFYEDMGPRPEGKTLDRIDVNGNYHLENCRWSTYKEQSKNRRKNVKALSKIVY